MPARIDRDALHRYLYRHTDHFGRYRMNLKALSEELDLAYCNLSVVITSMAKEGRLRMTAGTSYGAKTYKVRVRGWSASVTKTFVPVYERSNGHVGPGRDRNGIFP